MGLRGSRRVLLGQARLPTPSFDLNYGSAMALAGTETFTRASTAWYYNSAGVLTSAATNAARFDYDPSTLAAKGLLLETEARTNLWLNNQAVASWTSLGDTVITSDTAVAPDGTTTADTITMVASGTVPGSNITMVASTTYGVSIHVKDGATSAWLRCRIATSASSVSAYFNLSTGAVGALGTGMSGARVDTLASGWKRYSFLYLPAGGDEGSRSFSFSGVTANSGGTAGGAFTAWGVQVEAGASVTSYVGVTAGSTVTRAADVCAVTPLGAWFNASAGTLYAAYTPLAVTAGTQTVVYLDDASSNERLGIRSATGTLGGVVVDGGVVQATVSSGTQTVAATKVAIAYALNDIAFAAKGVLGTPDTTATLPTVTTLKIGARISTTEPMSGWYARVAYYSTRLPDATLQRLTA